MSDIYCGIGKTPKGKKPGSMKECAEKKQVRRYGTLKIDNLVLQSIEKGKSNKKELENLMTSFVGLGGKIKKLKGQIQAEKDIKEKEKLKKELTKLESKKETLKKEIAKLQK